MLSVSKTQSKVQLFVLVCVCGASTCMPCNASCRVRVFCLAGACPFFYTATIDDGADSPPPFFFFSFVALRVERKEQGVVGLRGKKGYY